MMALFAYNSAKDILAMNSFEVLRFIEEIESGRFSEIALDQKRRMEYRDFQNHLIRYFHNFLAAAKTLVEHTRNMMRSDLISEKHRLAYQKQVNTTFSDDLTKFVEDFRNYTLHFGLPPLVHSFSVDNDKWDVALNLKDLKRWEKWTAKSLRFIESHPKQIRLTWLVVSYQNKAVSLHEWLVNSFMEYYGDVFREFDEMKAAFFAKQKKEQAKRTCVESPLKRPPSQCQPEGSQT
jgi:hypothetical protein